MHKEVSIQVVSYRETPLIAYLLIYLRYKDENHNKSYPNCCNAHLVSG